MSKIIDKTTVKHVAHLSRLELDDKELEMLRELERYAGLQRAFLAGWDAAVTALQRAVARHGLDGLQVYPPADLGAATLRRVPRTLMGVALQEAEFAVDPVPTPPSVERSPEAEACRRAFRQLFVHAAPLAAVVWGLVPLYSVVPLTVSVIAVPLWAISLLWWIGMWSTPPAWMSIRSPRYFMLMAEHSMCQPG